MGTLITLGSIKFKSFLKRQRKGAAVLETVLLIIVAIVIIGVIIAAFVGKDAKGGFFAKIVAGIEQILNLNPLVQP